MFSKSIMSYSRRRASVSVLILSLALACTASPFEPDEIGSSPQIQDLFLNPPPRECPVFQDGSTTNSFPWTHPPTCSKIILPPSESHTINEQTFCVYTNSAFHAGRGISIITTPEVAAELSSEIWDHSTGAPSQTTNSSLWEAKSTPGKGIGLFAKKHLSPGETLIQLNPLLIVDPSILHSTSSSRLLLLEKAVSQLPPASQSLITNLSRRGGASPLEDIINVNAIRAKIWNLTSYLLIVPEVAVRTSPLLPPFQLPTTICLPIPSITPLTHPAHQPRLPPHNLLPLHPINPAPHPLPPHPHISLLRTLPLLHPPSDPFLHPPVLPPLHLGLHMYLRPVLLFTRSTRLIRHPHRGHSRYQILPPYFPRRYPSVHRPPS